MVFVFVVCRAVGVADELYASYSILTSRPVVLFLEPGRYGALGVCDVDVFWLSDVDPRRSFRDMSN
jgi:hypothetical protein